MDAVTRGIDQLTPFQSDDELIRQAKEHTRGRMASQRFFHSGGAVPDGVPTAPRDAFVLLGQFGLAEARRAWDEPSPLGMPGGDSIAERLDAFLLASSASPGCELLRRGVHYGTSALGFDADALVRELTDAVIGDNYHAPDRMLPHAERVVHRHLVKAMCADRLAAGTFDLFPVDGGAAAMCSVFTSLLGNHLLRNGDTIALATPTAAPHTDTDRPRLDDFRVTTLHSAQSQTVDGRQTWQCPDEEIETLIDPRIKALLLVNSPSSASFAMHTSTEQRIVSLVRRRRPDLLILTEDVYGTSSEGFRSLAADLPRNTILVYAYSKHFGCAGSRLGVVGVHHDNVFDETLAQLPLDDRLALRARYAALTMDPDRLPLIDRVMADSRDLAVSHTTGLSLPQQAQMMLFSLYALLESPVMNAEAAKHAEKAF